jgi:hypothetical protein
MEQANEGTIHAGAEVVVGYQPPDIACLHDTVETVQRLLNNDPAVSGVNVFLSIYDFEDDFSIEEEEDGSGVHKGKVADAIGRSSMLRKLVIYDPALCMMHGYVDLFPFFQRIAVNRSIEQLSLDFLDFSELDVFSILAPFFEHNHNLRCVKVSGSDVAMRLPSIIPALLQCNTIRLERIDFSYSHLGDDCAADLIDAISSMPGFCHLLDLFLKKNEIGREGCKALCNLLKNPNCNIQRMELLNNDLDDTCVEILANGMATNKTLGVFDLSDHKFATRHGWRTFSAFYLLNHFGTTHSDDVVTTMMPYAIGWIKRDCLGFAAMYDIIRSMPWLLDFKIKLADTAPEEPPPKIRKLD